MEENLPADSKASSIEEIKPQNLETENTSNKSNKSNKKIYILALVILGLFIFLAAGVYLYVYQGSNKSSVSINNSKANPTAFAVNPALKNLPKLAYIYTFGSKLSDSSSDVGGVFIVSADGSQKKITSIKKEDMQGVLTDVVYSPFVDKLLINTDKALIMVDPKTGEQKNIYNGKVWRVSLTKDGKYACPWIDGNNVKIQLDTLKVSPDTTIPENSFFTNDCEKDSQPMFDEKNNLLVDVRAVDVESGGAGNIFHSSEISVLDKNTGETKKFKLNEEGQFDPLFIHDNYLYFMMQQCCASTPFMNDLMQMNLKTGEVSEPTSIPVIKNELDKVKKFDSTFTDKERRGASIERAGVSSGGKYFIFSTSYPDGKDYTRHLYLYDIENAKATEINKSDIEGSWFTWTSDDRYLYAPGFIYDTKTDTKYPVNYKGPNDFLVFIK